jgi:hypothetical protein
MEKLTLTEAGGLEHGGEKNNRHHPVFSTYQWLPARIHEMQRNGQVAYPEGN